MRAITFVFILFILLCLTFPARGQEISAPAPRPTPSVDASAAQEDPGSEVGQIKKNCPVSSIFGCLQVLFTGHPIHAAVGSLAPQNGVAAGLAYVDGYNTVSGNWRDTWNADAVASPNGSWRTGLYMKFVDSRLPDIGIQRGSAGARSNPTELPEQPVIDVYAQSISLNELLFFGLGPNSSLAGRAFYGMRETIAGARVVKPLNDRVHAGLYAEFNGRWVAIRPPGNHTAPSIQSVYTEATAPGLTTQPFFVQPGAGVRMRPEFFNGRLRLDYDAAIRPYVAPADSRFSFARFDANVSHQIQLYGRGFPLPRSDKGPDDCSEGSSKTCPRQFTRDKVGVLDLRAMTSLSMLAGNGGAPFYFQPTLGGGDINGNSSLAGYTDYRFRAPNVLLVRESFEHSLGKWPVGLLLSADQGKVALLRGDLGSNPWIHGFATGLTLRAGGLPELSVQFAWGHEGTHIVGAIDPSLLGASSRPSLF